MAAKPAPPSVGPRLNLPIFLIALFGVLVIVHLWIQVQRGFTHGCLGFSAPTGEIAECAEVVGSGFGTFLGVSNVLWGLLFYVILAALRLGVALTRPPTSRTFQKASLAAVCLGMLYVVWLIYIQVFELDRFCVLCLISAATTTTLFALHVVEWRRAGRAEPAVARSVSLAPYGIGLAALALLAAADVAFLSDRAEGPGVVAANDQVPMRPAAGELAEVCVYDEEFGEFRLFDLFTSGRAGYEGADDASVRVLKIFDPNCPHCKTLHSVLEETVPQYEDQAQFYYQPLALWDFSVPQVQALYLAREAGNEPFIEMMELQLDAQQRGGLPLDTLVAFAERVGLDPVSVRADIERGRFADVIRQEYQMVTGAGVRGVPRLMVEGRMIANTQATWTPECIGYFVEQAARRRGS